MWIFLYWLSYRFLYWLSCWLLYWSPLTSYRAFYHCDLQIAVRNLLAESMRRVRCGYHLLQVSFYGYHSIRIIYKDHLESIFSCVHRVSLSIYRVYHSPYRPLCVFNEFHAAKPILKGRCDLTGRRYWSGARPAQKRPAADSWPGWSPGV